MQQEPWGGDVNPEYVHSIVDVATHPDQGKPKKYHACDAWHFCFCFFSNEAHCTFLA
jgi:hypothetical protein